ncbi:MAG: PilZ domain-containing protein [Thermoplasmata archaeon]|jgi:hypothetical protein|nr:PilZ domain-containing protein [Thermoplasmata archaeon]
MSTRRRLPRQPANWPGSYHFDDDADIDGSSCCVVDVSRMGAGIEVYGDTPVDPIGRRLTVDVRGPAGGSIGIRMAGEVRNVALGGTGGVRMGVEFVGLSDIEQAILDSLEQMQVAW